eukprot:1237413-Prymnesium_polylepis.2
MTPSLGSVFSASTSAPGCSTACGAAACRRRHDEHSLGGSLPAVVPPRAARRHWVCGDTTARYYAPARHRSPRRESRR